MPQEPLERRVLRFIRQHALASDQNLVVAVSGGPDSVCLLHVLVKLGDELKLRLHVAHINHQLRGADAEADARYVAELACGLGIPATIEERDVKGYRAQYRLSLEEAAREVRYAFLAEVARSIGASCVAVGHTADDHIETVLMHLVRGTGVRGLRGLQPCSRLRFSGHELAVIRPLLAVSRSETVAYCAYYQLKPRLDVSNLSLSPLRNKIRLQLLPLLRSYNRQIDQALMRTAQIAAEELAFIESEVARVWNEAAQKRESTVILNKEKLLELPPALQRHLLLRSLEELLGNMKDIEARHIEKIMAALTKPSGKRLNLPRGLTFTIEYDRYLISQGSSAATLVPLPALEGEFPLNIPGETLLPGWRIEAAIVTRELIKSGYSQYEAYLDFARAGSKITVRGCRRGDRFQPLGMGQPKKLGRFMIDARITRSWRPRVPIACSPEQVLWVVGWRIDERVKVTDKTEQVLYLKFERL